MRRSRAGAYDDEAINGERDHIETRLLVELSLWVEKGLTPPLGLHLVPNGWSGWMMTTELAICTMKLLL